MPTRKPHPDVWPDSQFTQLPAFIERPGKKKTFKPPTPAPPLEKEIEKKIGDYAKAKGCLYWKLTSPANRAVPDRMICTNRGVVGFLEVKRKGCKPTELQLHKLKELTDHGHKATWCDSVKDGCAFVDELVAAGGKEWV